MNYHKYKDKILRYWAYFRRGHSTYLAFLISLVNFIVIQYRLLISYISYLEEIFHHLSVFAVTFIIIYIPITTIIGWLDYTKGAVPIDRTIGARANPYYKDLAKALILMSEGKNNEARKILEKWV